MNLSPKRIFPVAAAIMALQAASAGAATLATYAFGTSSTSLDLTPTLPTAGVSAGSLTAGAGVTFNNSGVNLGTSTARAMGLTGTGVSTSEAGAITSNRYFTFTVTADPGQMISLERLTMNANLGGANSAPDFSIRIDTGSGFNTVAAGSITATSGSSGSPSNAIDLSFTEPAPGALSNLTGTVTFQLAFYNLSSTPTGWADWVRMDDISVIGTVAPVPEASVAILSLTGAAAGLVRRRR